MKNLFIATKNGISQISIIKEDEKYYYVENPIKRQIEKDLQCIYHDYDDNMFCYGETETDARNRFNSDIENQIEIYERKIKKLRKKII